MAVTNTLAFYDTATITTIKSFIVQPTKVIIIRLLRPKFTNMSNMSRVFFLTVFSNLV
jgi:hypothetical protein